MDLKIAMVLGRVRFIEEIICRTGWGIDFDRLENDLDDVHQPSSESKIEAPRFYCGLRIHGKYRRDWARASAPDYEASYHSTNTPIGFLAAYYGNTETIEWFFGDGPAKAIDSFIKTHIGDKRSAILDKVDWRKRLPGWYGIAFSATRDNAFHAAIAGGHQSSIDGINEVFRMVTNKGVVPLTLLESKQCFPKHDSLLMSARVSSHFPRIFEMYTAHGGDPTITDERGYNIFHILTINTNDRDLTFCFDHLSTEQKENMVLSRVARSLCTPIALAVRAARIDIVKMFLQYGTQQLRLRDGDGNLPIHTAISQGLANIVQILIDADPETIHVENTAGAVPVEIAQQRYLLSRTQTNPIAGIHPTWTECRYSSWWDDRPETKDFHDSGSNSDSTESEDAVTTFQVVTKAAARGSIMERQLVPLLDVADVICRATKFPHNRSNMYLVRKQDGYDESPDGHFTRDSSLWLRNDQEQ